jgi:hypothetical protein
LPQWWFRAPELLRGGKVTEKALQASKKCRCVEALRVDLHVGIGGVDIYILSSRRSFAAVVIERAGTALRWKSHREGLAGRVVVQVRRSVTGQSARTYRWCRYMYALKQEEKCRGGD